MLKTILWRSFLVGVVFLGGLVIGGLSGYEYAYWFSIYPTKKAHSERNQAFQYRLEAIESALPCEVTNIAGFSGPYKKDSIIYYLNVQDTDYQVIGLSTDSSGPLVSWSGEGRQPCDEPATSNPSLKREARSAPLLNLH